MSADDRRPGKRGYVLAGVALAVGLGAIALAVTAWIRLPDTIEGFTRICVPGTDQVVIDDPGRYVIYEEYRDPCGHAFIDAPPVDGLIDPSGRQVDLTPYPTYADYDMAGRHGIARFTFRAPEAGTYQVVTRLPATRSIAIGRDIGTAGSRLGTALRQLAIGLVGLLSGALIAGVTADRRKLAPPL